MANLNPLTLAADNNPKLIPLLHSSPNLASIQDEHGYSILHAAASYNHLDLLRTLVHDFHVNVNIKDEDEETPLFAVETVEAAQVLVEELGADVTATNNDGQTAEDKILTEGDRPTIAAFLKESRRQNGQAHPEGTGDEPLPTSNPLFSGSHPPPLPPNVTVNMGTMEEDQALEAQAEADPQFKQRIEELAAREDFQGEEGQRQLRELISDAVRGVNTESNGRQVRQRLH